MWPIQLAFRFLISCRIFLCSLTLSNTSFISHMIGPTDILHPSPAPISKLSRRFWSIIGGKILTTEIRSIREKTLPQCYFFHHKSHTDWHRSKRDLRSAPSTHFTSTVIILTRHYGHNSWLLSTASASECLRRTKQFGNSKFSHRQMWSEVLAGCRNNFPSHSARSLLKSLGALT